MPSGDSVRMEGNAVPSSGIGFKESCSHVGRSMRKRVGEVAAEAGLALAKGKSDA
jgi:hypothetical protein